MFVFVCVFAEGGFVFGQEARGGDGKGMGEVGIGGVERGGEGRGREWVGGWEVEWVGMGMG